MRTGKVTVVMCLLLAAVLSGCGAKEKKTITGIIFERGHGSAWGNQFYVDLREDEILTASYFPEGEQEQMVCDHIPITPQQWNDIYLTVQKLELQKQRILLLESLRPWQKLDGGEYRKLTLVWATAKGEERITYQWPDNQQADTLEKLLEQLVATTK